MLFNSIQELPRFKFTETGSRMVIARTGDRKKELFKEQSLHSARRKRGVGMNDGDGN